MNKRLLIACLFIVTLATAQEPLYDIVFFNNSRMANDYFFSKANATGNSSIRNSNGKIPVSETNFNSPGNSLRLDVRDGKTGAWEALIPRVETRGQDHFNKASLLSFWIYSEKKQTGAPASVSLCWNGPNNDVIYSNEIDIHTVPPKTWMRIDIALNMLSPTQAVQGDPIGIRYRQTRKDDNTNTIYLDDIQLKAETASSVITAPPASFKLSGYARHVDISWPAIKNSAVKFVKIYRSADKGKTFRAVGIQERWTNRYADYTGESDKTYQYRLSYIGYDDVETAKSASKETRTRTMSDDELMTMVQEASFRYYWDGAEPNSGLARENISGRHNMIATGASGFGIMALVVGMERKFITREEGIERFTRIVNFLEKADRFHGVYPHFLDGISGKVEPFFGQRDNGGDLVETSFLMQGLLTARAYFTGNDPREKIIHDKISAIWNTVEWDWYRRYPDSKFLYWHWSPDHAWIINHRLIGWNETMVTYLLAIASPTHAVPASLYYSGWANQDSTGQQYRSAWGGTKDGSHYTNGNIYQGVKLDVGVSTGGPLFFTHYSYLGYDPHAITDAYTNYFTNNQNIAVINYRYCMDNPGRYKGYGDSCWGLTASDGPYNYSADEPVLRQDRGKIGPTGAVSSFPYMPQAAMKAMKNYYFNYGKFLWGEYGFRDAFNLTENWCSDIYMGLNQAPMTVMIENYRTGLPWKLFMSNPEIQSGLKKLAEEKPSR